MRESVRGPRAEVLDAIDRVDSELLDVDTLEDAQRDIRPGGSAAPHFAVELRLRANAIPADAKDDVADLDSGQVPGALGRDARNDEPTLHLIGGDAEPRPRRARGPSGPDEVGEDRFQRIDRDEHVAGNHGF